MKKLSLIDCKDRHHGGWLASDGCAKAGESAISSTDTILSGSYVGNE